ncbi:MAG: hypothetical protein GY941_21480 [Planctomycetes bacterium]|nr:hypothetical protein [Planctomycetota bacterium]
MAEKRKELYTNEYMTLFSDGEIGISDGVGYIDTMNKWDVNNLYIALHQYFENADND